MFKLSEVEREAHIHYGRVAERREIIERINQEIEANREELLLMKEGPDKVALFMYISGLKVAVHLMMARGK